ncbi:TMV resistance protein N-like isoform X2 [Macadamia integrifolia]|uniref:TMV resistance protein N-like isoform X2 n=1 Tax=Macadamia integrifolia TaxID=60698 RepID=UPI001C4F5F71|nr:TMV resistance protein N-like isoform X2 [Macadamia integrifolia]
MADLNEDSSSAFSSPYSKYDVFLNFRGADTRKNFTDFLHKALKNEGINDFIDSENLWTGEAINPALIRTIGGSKIAIPVFSSGYASSKWCLQELSLIHDCYKSNGQIALPIFLDVEPSYVRNQTGSFEGPFQEHERQFMPQIVENWREALRVIGSLKGWVLNKDTNGDQAALVEVVVKRVLDELNSNIHLVACKYPIGIDSHINSLLSLLNSESNDAKFVGICGFGGIGKTTIAKAVYNRIFSNFKGHSFLSDIREQIIRCKGLVSLQKQLLKDISKMDIDICDYHRGKHLIKQRLCKEKVLLVLDDVDDKEHLDALAGELNWFGKGSRVIITTRDEHILDVAKVGKDKIYWPQELNYKESLQLFSLHAFSMNQPPDDYMQLSQDVAWYLGGLPLAVEVLGSYLSDVRDKEVWKSTLQSLKEIPDKEVQRKLRISYNNLEDEYQKSLFLDFACSFIGCDKETVISIWEASGYYPKSAIHRLIKRSLIKFEYKEYGDCCLMMHDLIRDMGRRIVLEENLMEPSNGEILQLLTHKGTDKIKGMILPTRLQSVPLASEHFEMISNLRFLDINSVHFRGDFPPLPSTLKWFRWKRCPLDILPANFYHKRLVNLDLSGSMIEEAWNIRSQNETKRFQNLKVLVLSDCTYLAESPDSSWFPHLERLDLGNCRSLEKLNESIGQFSQLKNLNLKRCDSLKKLPDSIGKLKSLVQLDLSWLTIEELPNSISRLSSLEELSLEGCRSLKSLPESIGGLKSLVELKLTNVSKIKELPDGVGLLEKLMVLDAYGCYKLVKLPRSMGRMRCLHSINLRGDNISNIPDDFSMLSNLFKLKMSATLQSLPTDLSHLKYLKQLNLFKCVKLEYLPELPLSLVELCCEDCFSLVRLPDLSRLKVLAILCLEGCIKLEEIRGLGGKLSLVELNARGCHNLTITPRKILGQGTLLPERPPLRSFSLTAIDGIYKKWLILCLVLELPSDFSSQTIYCDISASIRQKDNTISCVHTLRIEDVEFTTNQNLIYLHHFKEFDWFGIPLHGKDAIENLYIHQSELRQQLSWDNDSSRHFCRVKFWKILFENREPSQQKPNGYSSASMVEDFFNWSFESRETNQQEPNRHSSAMMVADFSNWSFENREYEQQMLNQHSTAMMVADFFDCSYVNVSGGLPPLKLSNIGVRGSSSNVPKEVELTAIERLIDEASPPRVEEALLRATVRPVLNEDDEAACRSPVKDTEIGLRASGSYCFDNEDEALLRAIGRIVLENEEEEEVLRAMERLFLRKDDETAVDSGANTNSSSY